MAVALIGGALLSAFLQVAFDRLASRKVLDFFRGRKLDETLLNKLNISLHYINSVADDAEQKQFRDPRVKSWLDAVKDAVFEADDLLDEIDILVSKSDLEAESKTCTCKVWNFFPAAATSSFEKEIESRMKQVIDNLEYFASKKDMLDLKEAISHGVGWASQKFPPTTSLVRESVMYGRDVDKEIIFNWLISDTENDNQLSIISVVGMGGVGKTTLAQHSYNDPRVQGRFDMKGWVCVSDDFDVFKVSRAILEAFTKSTDDSRDLEMVHGRLKENLRGMRFLLVLDDVWNERRDLWEALKTPLTYGARGSKVLVTTRSMKVASVVQANKIHPLEQLQEDQCWRLFAKHAFQDVNTQSNTELEEIGIKIVKKCKGLPLALKTIGSLLYTKSSVMEWESLLKSEMWELPEQDSNVIPALLLSYHHLPSHLKRCFAYCSLFPNDYEFEKEHLIWLWMAENFLKSPRQGKSMEEVGEQYFDDLLSRSFFQQSSRDKRHFVMHDLVNDLAKYVSGDFCFRLEGQKTQNMSKITRHVSLGIYYVRSFERFKDANRLRTFLPLAGTPVIVIDDLLSKCKLLRVLSLSHNRDVTDLPDSLGSLKHLRYLDLSRTSIRKLPDSTCKLCNLQLLKLEDCGLLELLPSELHKLTNLRYLDFSGTKVRNMPMHLGKLKNLQVLKSFYVGKGSECGIQQLGELNLHGTLSIHELQNVVNPLDAILGTLRNKIHLVRLKLEWSGKHNNSQKEGEVLENLQPPKRLKELFIINYVGKRFPGWFGDSSFSNMVSLVLKNCENCVSLPSLGLLPSLKDLSIRGLLGLVIIDAEFYGSSSSSTISFPSLETLIFTNMKGWEEWKCLMGAFPRLRYLRIENCPKLKEHLPEQLPCLLELSIFDCPQLVASVPSSAVIQELQIENCGKVKFNYHPYTLKTVKINSCHMEGSLVERIGHTISDNASPETSQNFGFPDVSIPIRHCYSFLVCLNIKSGWDSLKDLPLDFFPKLQSLHLEGCGNLETISQEHGQSLSFLTYLEITDCPKFVSFPSGGLSAPKLNTCVLSKLESFKSMPECMHILLPNLTCLRIKHCPQLESLSGGCFPSNLHALYLTKCSKLIAGLKGAFGPNNSLIHLEIEDVEVESFPDEGLLPLGLGSLCIRNSPNLQKLDGKGLCHLSSLSNLSLIDCPRLE